MIMLKFKMAKICAYAIMEIIINSRIKRKRKIRIESKIKIKTDRVEMNL